MLPDSVTSIGECAFEDCISLTSIKLPKNIETIGFRALGYTSYYKEMYDFKIFGYQNSAAVDYAKINDIDFIDLDKINYDVDGNVKVTALDLVKMKKQILGYETQYAQTADVNNDGKVDSLDLVAMIKYLLEN